MVKSSFSDPPSKGTKSRDALIAAFSGGTASDIAKRIGWNAASVTSTMVRMRDDCGYDIRAFAVEGSGLPGRPGYFYKCVGKMKWDGSYRSFIHDDIETILDDQTQPAE